MLGKINSPNGHRSSRPEVFCKKYVLRNFANSQENTCEFCEIFKNNFSDRTPPVAAFADSQCFLFLP